MDWGQALREAVIPVATAYLVVLAVLALSVRARRAPARRAPGGPGESGILRYLVGTAAAGYLFFLGIVVAFYFALGGLAVSFVYQGLAEGSLLAFLTIPAFLLLSWIEARIRRRPRRPAPPV